jgi:cytochrome bd-type quinol oxidase subunit 1
LFSTLVCCWFVAALSAYDYLKAEQYPFARIGLGFAILSIVILLLEAIVWGADRMVLRSAETVAQPEFTELNALFSSLHSAV